MLFRSESGEFYQKWAGAWDRSQWQGPLLDPLAAQTQYSPVLLRSIQVPTRIPGLRAASEGPLPAVSGRGGGRIRQAERKEAISGGFQDYPWARGEGQWVGFQERTCGATAFWLS